MSSGTNVLKPPAGVQRNFGIKINTKICIWCKTLPKQIFLADLSPFRYSSISGTYPCTFSRLVGQSVTISDSQILLLPLAPLVCVCVCVCVIVGKSVFDSGNLFFEAEFS